MRGIRLLLALVVTLACAPAATVAPKTAATSLAPRDAYAVAVRELASMGYQVVAGDPTAGFLRAEKTWPMSASGNSMIFNTIGLTFGAAGAGTAVHVATWSEVGPVGGERQPGDRTFTQLGRDAAALLARLQTADQ